MKNRMSRRRSEQIRRKLKIESQDSIRRASRRAVEPPVNQASRGGFIPISESAKESTSGAIKRRFKVGWRVLSLLICGILSYILFIAWQSPEYRVSEVRISGLHRISETDVKAAINVIGMHSFAVTPGSIEKEILAAFPEFRQVIIKVWYPAVIEIHVVERQPMIAWQEKNTLVWVDSEGYLIPPRGAAGEMLTIDADSLPAYHLKNRIEDLGTEKIIQDMPSFKANPSALAFFAQPKQIDGALLAASLQLNAWMPSEKTLLYQRKRGLGWKDTRGWDVFVGQKLEDINDKMVMYETVIRELNKQGINPTVVSVEFLHAPYYRTD